MTFPSRWHLNRLKKGSFAASSLVLLSFASPKMTLDQVVNNTKSIVVDALTQDKTGYKLLVRNSSTLAASSLTISVTSSKGVCDLHAPWPAASGRPFIGPNQEREIHLPFPGSKTSLYGPGGESCPVAMDNVRRVQPSVTPRIVIDAVDFGDGACEGDREMCAMMEAARLGVETQHQRIAALVEEEMKSDGHGDWVGALTLRVSSLSDEPQQAIIDSIQTRFQQSASANRSLWLGMQGGLRLEQNLVLNNLKGYGFIITKTGKPKVSPQEWWDVTKGRCDFFVPHTCC